MKTLRNIAIIALLAAAIVALPGGGRAADLVGAILSVVFAALLGYFGIRTYRERRLDIYGMGDRERGIFYAALGLAALTLTASSRLLASGIGALVWVALVALCAWGFVTAYRAWRRY